MTTEERRWYGVMNYSLAPIDCRLVHKCKGWYFINNGKWSIIHRKTRNVLVTHIEPLTFDVVAFVKSQIGK